MRWMHGWKSGHGTKPLTPELTRAVKRRRVERFVRALYEDEAMTQEQTAQRMGPGGDLRQSRRGSSASCARSRRGAERPRAETRRLDRATPGDTPGADRQPRRRSRGYGAGDRFSRARRHPSPDRGLGIPGVLRPGPGRGG